MLPVLLRLSFTSLWMQLLLYAVAVGVVSSIAVNGWKGAVGPVDAATDKAAPASLQDKLLRAGGFAAMGLGLAYFGLMYALPPEAFPGGKGEGIPLHTYGVLLALGF
ncbi:MAG: prolipoprotein diacylglyceryl transferase, partial [Myxococcaceae bacterium]